jgi:hypothetical protein
VQDVAPLEVQLVCRQVRRGAVHEARPRAADAAGSQPHPERGDDGPPDLLLHGEEVGRRAVVRLGPEHAAVRRGDELRGHLEAAGTPAHAALEHGRHAERVGDRADGERLPLEGERGGTPRNPEARHLGEGRDHLVGEPIGEVLVPGIATRVRERQHGD